MLGMCPGCILPPSVSSSAPPAPFIHESLPLIPESTLPPNVNVSITRLPVSWSGLIFAPVYWFLESFRVGIGDFKWYDFIYDTRHTPEVLAVGKARSLAWSFLYLSLPLGLFTSLWLIRVLNITLGSLSKSVCHPL